MNDSKNSQRVSPDEMGRPENPAKNSRADIGGKMGASAGAPSEATPSTPSKNSRQVTGAKNDPSEMTPSEVTPKDGKEAATTLQGKGQNIPFAVGGGAPAERADKADNDKAAPNLTELSARLEALKRQQRNSAVRGALLVFLPPVVLCLPLLILKGCKLLLLSWWWCVSPLLLWAFPIGFIFSIFVQAYRLFRQQDKQDKAAADRHTERG